MFEEEKLSKRTINKLYLREAWEYYIVWFPKAALYGLEMHAESQT